MDPTGKNMNIYDSIKSIYFDTKTVVYDPFCSMCISEPFESTPREYFSIANKYYYSDGNDRFNEVIANCKRAIDCQIDSFYKYFKINIESKSNDIIYVKEYIKYFEENCHKIIDSGLKLNLLNVLDVIPIKLISDIRKYRNTIEHEYKKAEKKVAEQSLEITHLFLNATDYVFNGFAVEYSFGYNEEKLFEKNTLANGIWIKYNTVLKYFNIEIYQNRKLICKEKIFQQNRFYLPLLHISLSIDAKVDHSIAHKYLLYICGINIGENKLDYIDYNFKKYHIDFDYAHGLKINGDI